MLRPLLRISKPLLTSTGNYRSLSTTSIYLAPKKQQRSSSSTTADSTRNKKLKDEKVPGQVLMPDISSGDTNNVGNKGPQDGEGASIPSEPSNYSVSPSNPSSITSTSSSSPSLTEYEFESSAPKISTAAGLETHLSGGPTSGLSGDDVQQGERGDGRESLNSKDDISRSNSNDEGKKADRGDELSSEEKKGLVVLAGILVGGFVLGGITRPRSRLNLEIEERNKKGIEGGKKN